MDQLGRDLGGRCDVSTKLEVNYLPTAFRIDLMFLVEFSIYF